jgi:tRNA(fMet)-specific endonuclease VapC
MDAVVLDTDVFSYFFKQDTRARLYEADVRARRLCLCFQTIAEVKAWAISRNWGKVRRNALEKVLAHYLVLPYDAQMADAWARITVARRRSGRPIACGDGWIAAAALRHDIPLLTHNTAHYAEIPGLVLLSHPAEGA